MLQQQNLSVPHVEANGVKSDGLRVVTCGKYTYRITSSDLKMETEAFEVGEGVSRSIKLVESFYSVSRDLDY